MNDPDELDRLVDELNAATVDGSRRPPRLEAWLAALRQHQGSDLYLVAGAPPCVRVQGAVRRLDENVLDPEDIETQVLPALPTHAAAAYRTHGVADTSLRIAPGVRFRVNLHRERGHAAASIRALPARPPRLDELRLPTAVEGLTRVPHGLVLIGGPTGSGKTTTVAALVDLINGRDARHIVTIEDPIEFEHPHARSVVEQVEIGVDAPDFATALRSAVRQSPDVIVIGEMRDPETMRIALAAGETGHLVLSTLHTGDVASTVSRIADGFPAERQPSIRQEMSMALAAVMTQILVPKIGGGRVPAVELLMVGYGARQQIRKNALQHLHQEITMSRRAGSCTFEESLAQLVRHGWIDVEDARARAIHRDELEGLLAGFAGPGGAGSRISP
jgi:twitching motility protein PilT